MKRKTISIFAKTCFILLGLLASLFLSVLMAELLVFDSLSNFSASLISLLVGAFVVVLFVYITRLFASTLRHASVTEIIKVAIITAALLVALVIVRFVQDETTVAWCIIVTGIFFIISCFVITSYRSYSLIKLKLEKNSCEDKKRALIVGAGSAGITILREIQTSDKLHIYPVGFIDDVPNKLGT